jgi:hypothetical protein
MPELLCPCYMRIGTDTIFHLPECFCPCHARVADNGTDDELAGHIRIRFACPGCDRGTIPVMQGHGMREGDPSRIRWMCLFHALLAVMPVNLVMLRMDLGDVQLPVSIG